MAKVTALKYENIQKVRQCFYDRNIYCKQDLVDLTGISRAGMTNILANLLEKKEILYLGDAASTGGRKSKQYQLNPHYRHLGLMNLSHANGEDQLDYVISDLYGEELSLCHRSFSHLSTDDILTALRDHEDPLLATLVISIPGVSVEGDITICDIDGLSSTPLKAHIQKAIDVDVIIENDVNVACVGFSQDIEASHLALMYQPDHHYIGVGMMVNGALYNGAHHYAGELRYMPFYSHKKQDELLKVDPLGLLKIQMQMLCCVMDPEVIGVYSEAITITKDDLQEMRIPSPHIVVLDDFNAYIKQGLYAIGLKNVLMKEELYHDQ